MSMIETPTMQGLERVLDISVFRQQLLAANIANVDTPGYHTRDVRPFNLELAALLKGGDSQAMTPAAGEVRGLLERPDGNNVSIERESLLMAENQLRFQMAEQFLKKQFNQIAMAINGSGTSV